MYDAPGRVITWGKNGVLAPLNDMFTDDLLNDLDPALADAVQANGNYYLYPINTAPFMMAFNKTMLEDLGLLDLLPLDRENRAWSVTEYETLLAALKEAGKVPAIFYAKILIGLLMYIFRVLYILPLINFSYMDYFKKVVYPTAATTLFTCLLYTSDAADD